MNWISMEQRRPAPGTLIVKKWKSGSVWAGVYTGGEKDASFDEWCELPPSGDGRPPLATEIGATGLQTLAKQLRDHVHGKTEWRVADPASGAYCMSFDHDGEVNPEAAARAWLADHRRNFPEGRFAHYEVCRVVCYSSLERLALQAADRLSRGAGGGDLPGLDEEALPASAPSTGHAEGSSHG